jgi:hypothetical protein
MNPLHFEANSQFPCDKKSRNVPFTRTMSMTEPHSKLYEAQWFGSESQGENVNL